MAWTCFLQHWPFVREIHRYRWPMVFPTKCYQYGAVVLSFLLTWANSCKKSWAVSDLRRRDIRMTSLMISPIVFGCIALSFLRGNLQDVCFVQHHYCDVIMGAMASQITSLIIVYSTVYSGAHQRKHQSSVSLAFVTGEFPAQMASNAENVFIWWRHHVY